MTVIFYLTWLYFAIGAVAIIAIVRKHPEQAKQQWLKYGLYLLIVHTVIASIVLGYFKIVAIILSLIAVYEWIKRFPFPHRSISVFSFFLVLFLAVLAGFLYFSNHKTNTEILDVYFIVFCFDGFSQLCGQLFGKKHFTRISPNKTLEGTIGGAILTLITGCLIHYGELFYQIMYVITPVIIIAAFAGDWLASAYKRYCGIKDFSNLIPGHGGVLDRFDSFILAGALSVLI